MHRFSGNGAKFPKTLELLPWPMKQNILNDPNSEEAKTEPSSADKSKFALFRSQSMHVLVDNCVDWHTGDHSASDWHIINLAIIGPRSSTARKSRWEILNSRPTKQRAAGSPALNFPYILPHLRAWTGLPELGWPHINFAFKKKLKHCCDKLTAAISKIRTLIDLKRQIREQVNQVLGNRVVSDVIIANLKITASENKEPAPAADTASTPPWFEKSSSYVSQQSGK